MFFVDTNILLYAVNSDSLQFAEASSALEKLANAASPWAMSWSVVYEFMRVATHPKVFPTPLDSQKAWTFVSELISHPNCLLIAETSEHGEMTSQCLSESPRTRGNLVHDFHIAVLMREHGIQKILTEDHDYKTFHWVDPVSLREFSEQ